MTEPERRGTPIVWVVVAIAIALVLIIGVFLGYNLMAGEDFGVEEQTTQAAPSSASEKTITAPPSTSSTTKPSQGQPQPTQPQPTQPQAQPPKTEPSKAPPKPTPEQMKAQQYTSFDHNGHTSAAFAANVYSAWQHNYAGTGHKAAQLRVFSPTTGQTYSMQCFEAGTSVRCVGGDNALVSIF